jgi:hypothetical protein
MGATLACSLTSAATRLGVDGWSERNVGTLDVSSFCIRSHSFGASAGS